MDFGANQPRLYKTDDGGYVPSVTSILSILNKGDGFGYWQIKCAFQVVQGLLDQGKIKDSTDLQAHAKAVYNAWRKEGGAAAKSGTKIHDSIEAFLRSGTQFPKPKNLEEENAMKAAFKFFLDYTVEPLEIEVKVIGPNFGGRADLLCRIDGVTWLLDWKTSKKMYDTYRLQLAAYRSVFPDVEKHGAVLFSKETGEYELVDCTDTYERDLELFQLIARFYELSQAQDLDKAKELVN